MSDSRLQQIIEKVAEEIEDEITAAGSLSFLLNEDSPVAITNIRPPDSRFKNYKRYQIVLYPSLGNPIGEVAKLGSNVSRTFSVGIVLYRKAQKKRKLLIFSDSNDIDSGVGVLEFGNAVMDILRYTNLDGTVNRRGVRLLSDPALSDAEESGVATFDFEMYCEVLTAETAVL